MDQQRHRRDACQYPAETTETFCDAHIAALTFFGGVPMSILQNNRRIAPLGDRGPVHEASSLLFDDRTSPFGSGRLTGALLDRLTRHVHILEMNGESYG